MTTRPFIINFHGIGPPSRTYEPGEEPYWLDCLDFKNILDFVAEHSAPARFLLTFDDGNSSDLTIAAPELYRRGLTASFFPLVGRIGCEGYLSKPQLLELSAEGFEIGSHGFDHIAWTAASDTTLAREIGGSKEVLEDLTGRMVHSASLPFGFYDRRVLRELMRHGYQRIFSSDGGPRLTAAQPIPRYTVQREINVATLARKIKSASRFLGRARTEARVFVRALRRR